MNHLHPLGQISFLGVGLKAWPFPEPDHIKVGGAAPVVDTEDCRNKHVKGKTQITHLSAVYGTPGTPQTYLAMALIREHNIIVRHVVVYYKMYLSELFGLFLITCMFQVSCNPLYPWMLSW